MGSSRPRLGWVGASGADYSETSDWQSVAPGAPRRQSRWGSFVQPCVSPLLSFSPLLSLFSPLSFSQCLPFPSLFSPALPPFFPLPSVYLDLFPRRPASTLLPRRLFLLLALARCSRSTRRGVSRALIPLDSPFFFPRWVLAAARLRADKSE